MNSFTERRAVVSGGAHGIGAAIVRMLRGAGAEVLVLDLDPGVDSARTLAADLGDLQRLPALAREAIRELGRCDILVNCAGMSARSELRELDQALYDRVLAVNLHAPVLLMKELGVPMADQGYGRIVNITSVHGRLSEPGGLAYDVSKAGLEAATRSAALELASAGVLVNAVAPGFVDTRMSIVAGRSELESDWFQAFYVRGERLPMRRAASPSEIAEAVGWLAGDSNRYVTGQVLTVDGGLTARF